MMRIFDGRKYRDATLDEIAALEREAQEQPPTQPTTDERLAALEGALLEMMGVTG